MLYTSSDIKLLWFKTTLCLVFLSASGYLIAIWICSIAKCIWIDYYYYIVAQCIHLDAGWTKGKDYNSCFTALWILSRTTRVSRHQKGKTNLDLLEQEIVSGSGISWAICKSAPHLSSGVATPGPGRSYAMPLKK